MSLGSLPSLLVSYFPSLLTQHKQFFLQALLADSIKAVHPEGKGLLETARS